MVPSGSDSGPAHRRARVRVGSRACRRSAWKTASSVSATCPSPSLHPTRHWCASPRPGCATPICTWREATGGHPEPGHVGPRGDRCRRGARSGRRPLRAGRRPRHPRPRRHGRRLLVRRVRVLPQRATAALRAVEADHRHVRRDDLGVGTVAREAARQHRRSGGTAGVRWAHGVRRGEEALRAPRGPARARSR